jgi:cobalt-zinc-cadmium efflux system protein
MAVAVVRLRTVVVLMFEAMPAIHHEHGVRNGAPKAHAHGHCHHHHAGAAGPSKRLAVVLALTTVYMFAEAFGGWFTNSLALLSDAGHMLADVAAITLSMLAIWFGSRPATPRKTYGYYRLEILAAFANGVALVVLALVILYEAYDRFMEPPEVASVEMMVIAGGGLLVNLLAVWILRGRSTEETRTLNEHGAYLHILGDLIGSVGALIAGGLMFAWGLYLADPIASVVTALLIVFSSVELIREAANVLLEGTPSHINVAAVREAILAIDGVVDVHDLHVWSITSGKDALSAHVVCDCEVYSKGFVEGVRRTVLRECGISHLTIQLETPDFDEDEVHF